MIGLWGQIIAPVYIMKQEEYLYKVVPLEELEETLNNVNTNRLLANIISIEEYRLVVIVWDK
jgi:hypothetical protein